MKLFGNLFNRELPELTEFLKRGAVILDVRTPKEFESGHAQNAINIPVQELENRVEEIKGLDKPIITYCKSGMRSANAVTILKKAGIEAINGVSQQNIKTQMKANQ